MKKSTFKLLMVAIILCLPLLKSVAQIPIGSVDDLRKIGVDTDFPMNGSYELTNDIDLSGVTDWVPIGMTSGRTFGTPAITNFTGTFDGKGYAIKNLTYTFNGNYTGKGAANTNSDELTGGIFGRIAGTVKNLELRNLTMTGNCVGALSAALAVATVNQVSVVGCTITGGYEVGGITGRTNNSPQTIKDCYVDPTTKIIGVDKVGGLVGNIYQSGTINITNCYVAVTMESTSETAVYGLLGATNGGVEKLTSVFVMAQAKAGTTLKPFAPDGKTDAASVDYYACSNYFPAETYPELYPVEETDPSFVKTLAELQTMATYADLGWDFDGVWQIAAGEFPIFQWQKYSGQDAINVVNKKQLWNANGLNNCIEVTVSEPMFLSVYDITGRVMFNAQVNNQVSIPANKGIYILKGKGSVQKLIVK